MIKIKQSKNNFPVENIDKSLETKLREDATQLRRRKISNNDRVVGLKRVTKSKRKKVKQTRYIHGSAIVIMDESHLY